MLTKMYRVTGLLSCVRMVRFGMQMTLYTVRKKMNGSAPMTWRITFLQIGMVSGILLLKLA